MNMNYNYSTKICENIVTQMYKFLVVFFPIYALKLFMVKIKKNVNNTKKYIYLGQTTFPCCSG